MTAEVLSEKMDNLASGLIEVALEPSYQSLQKLDYFERESVSLIQTVEDHRTEYYPAIPSSIRLLSSLACLPSLQAVARGRPQGNQLAKRIFSNYQSLHNSLFAKTGFIVDDLRSYDLDVYKDTVGVISEKAILGILWWGLARGKRSQNPYSYALPTTKSDDDGVVMSSGERTGVDIKLYSNRTLDTQPLQVKTKHNIDDKRPYIPEIPVITIEDLRDDRGRKQNGPFGLIKWLAFNDVAKLDAVSSQIDVVREEARVQSVAHRVAIRQTWQQQLDEIGSRLFGQTPASIAS